MRESWGDQAAIEAGEKKVELARVPSVLYILDFQAQRETEDSMLTTCEDPRVSRHAGDPEELCFRNKKSCSYNLERWELLRRGSTRMNRSYLQPSRCCHQEHTPKIDGKLLPPDRISREKTTSTT
jgi:hypothetical protein